MTLPKITPTRIILLIAIGVIIFLLHDCNGRNNQLADYRERLRVADSLKESAQTARMEESGKSWEYKESLRVERLRADSLTKLLMAIRSTGSGQSAEIRRLYALLRAPWPVDTLEVASACCDTAKALADSYESLLAVDSAKDASFAAQLDLATQRISEVESAALGWERRYIVSDSIARLSLKASKPRAKVLLGVGGGAAPGFYQGGVSLGLLTRKNVLLLGHAGLSNVGMYYEGKWLKTISLRKK